MQVFSTCPQSSSATHGEGYLKNIIDVARWSEESGCKGTLIYTDNSIVDPWLVAQIIIESTQTLCPLIAVQPVYMHPYSVAKMVASLGFLYRRRIYLNMVAGGFKNDLTALNDQTPHDQRYDRLVEYMTIVMQLFSSTSPTSYKGKFYSVDKLKLVPSLPRDLFPGIFVSGSSDAGLAAAKAVGAIAIKYPRPVEEYEKGNKNETTGSGIRVGVIARETSEEAWKVAHERFPEDRRGQITQMLAMKVSDSVWHKQLSQMGQPTETDANPYWMIPFKNYKSFCPYLVGSYDRVAEELARYSALGYKTFILDIPPSEEELRHIGIVFSIASGGTLENGLATTAVGD